MAKMLSKLVRSGIRRYFLWWDQIRKEGEEEDEVKMEGMKHRLGREKEQKEKKKEQEERDEEWEEGKRTRSCEGRGGLGSWSCVRKVGSRCSSPLRIGIRSPSHLPPRG